MRFARPSKYFRSYCRIRKSSLSSHIFMLLRSFLGIGINEESLFGNLFLRKLEEVRKPHFHKFRTIVLQVFKYKSLLHFFFKNILIESVKK